MRKRSQRETEVEDAGEKHGFFHWKSLGSPPDMTPNLSTTSASPSQVLAGVIDDMDF